MLVPGLVLVRGQVPGLALLKPRPRCQVLACLLPTRTLACPSAPAAAWLCYRGAAAPLAPSTHALFGVCLGCHSQAGGMHVPNELKVTVHRAEGLVATQKHKTTRCVPAHKVHMRLCC